MTAAESLGGLDVGIYNHMLVVRAAFGNMAIGQDNWLIEKSQLQ